MTSDDYFNAQKFPDAVCRSAYPIDIHDEVLNLTRAFHKNFFLIESEKFVANFEILEKAI